MLQNELPQGSSPKLPEREELVKLSEGSAKQAESMQELVSRESR
jgi:hypothetical protein